MREPPAAEAGVAEHGAQTPAGCVRGDDEGVVGQRGGEGGGAVSPRGTPELGRDAHGETGADRGGEVEGGVGDELTPRLAAARVRDQENLQPCAQVVQDAVPRRGGPFGSRCRCGGVVEAGKEGACQGQDKTREGELAGEGG